MEFLLLLTALFASLTGAISGERAQVQGVTVVHAAQTTRTAAQTARRTLPAAVMPAARIERAVPPVLAQAPIRSIRLIFERRLE